MSGHDHRDIIGGALLAMFGGFLVWHAAGTLDFGTVRRMGPGMFPMSIGIVLIGFGGAILATGFFRSGKVPNVEWRSAAAVLGSICFFAAAIVPLGLIPAIVGLIVISSLAEQQRRPYTVIAMSIILPLSAYLIFRIGLGLPLTMLRNPF